MASTIKLKRSLTPGAVPGSLEAGELAINIADKKLFSSNGSSVFNVSGDQYNLTSSTSDQGKAKITLTVDNETLANDSIEFLGGTGINVTRNANDSITIASDGTVAESDAFSSAVTVALTGDVTGSATFTSAGDTASIATTIQPNSVALGTDTTGNYAASVANTDNNIVVTGAAGEGTAFTVGLAGTISSDTTGNAATATALATARTIQISGDQAGSASFDGTGNINIAVTTQNDSVDLGTHTTGNYVATVAAGPDIDVSGSGEGAAVTVGLAATIAANTTGNAATATALATARTIALGGDVTGSASFDGTGNITITSTIAADSVALGTDTTGNYVASVTGTANEIEVSGTGEGASVQVGLPDNVTVGNNLTVSGNTAIVGDLSVDGNLEVNGTLTYIDSTTVTIGDNLLKLANTNSADTIDTGFYSLYNSGGNKYTGLVRDATDGSYYLFDSLATEPGQTINFNNATISTLNAVIDGGTF